MKHVFEFYGKRPQATGSGYRYVGKDPTEWTGIRAELLIVDTNGDGDSGDSLYLEGDGASLRMALMSALRIIDAVEKVERDRLSKHSEEPPSDDAIARGAGERTD
jgi:hypothetical protein